VATTQITYWQEIPSQVDGHEPGGAVHRQPLGARFQELIDIAAARRGLAGSDAYLEGWARGPMEPAEGTAAEAATRVAAELEARFEEIRAAALARRAS